MQKGKEMPNRLLEKAEYKIEETKLGRWRRYGYPNGTNYHEFVSRAQVFGMPLIHYTYGKNPETGSRVVARGVIAIGRFAFGILAIGQFALGLFAIGQFAVALIFGLGQLSAGLLAVGQAAMGGMFGLGQFAMGYVVIGQLAFGKYVLAQVGNGKYVWCIGRCDFEAAEFFRSLPILRHLLP